MECGCLYDDKGRPTEEMIVREERDARANELTDFQVKFITEATAVMDGEDEKKKLKEQQEQDQNQPGFGQFGAGM